MTVRSAVPFGATKDRLAWFTNLPAGLRPALRARHDLPCGFNQKITPLNAGNAEQACEMYAGRFTFAGQTVAASPSEIFTQNIANPEWCEKVMGLDWLANFVASNRNLHDQYAMRLLHYWSKSRRASSGIEGQINIIIALASNGQIIAQRCEVSVQTHYFEIVAVELKILLRQTAKNAEQSINRAVALLYALNAFQGLGHLYDLAYELIERHLDHVILEDGGHVSRQVGKLVEFLELAVPLQQITSPIMPPKLSRAIDNVLVMLKLLRRPDGELTGLLNERLDLSQLGKILDGQIPELNFAPQSGFARIQYEKATLIADTSTNLGVDFFDGKQKLMQTKSFESTPMQNAMMQNAPQGTVLMMQNTVQKRTCFLSADGQDLRVEDEFGVGAKIEIIIQVASGIKLSSLMDGQAVMFVLPDQSVWHLKMRGGTMQIHQSKTRSEIIIRRNESADQSPINWSLKKQAKANKGPRKKPSFETGLLI